MSEWVNRHVDLLLGIWLVAFVLSPLLLWWLSGISVRDKWMGAGDDRSTEGADG